MTITVIVTPVGHTSRGPVFDGRVDGRLIVTRSPTPLCDAARALLADSVDPGAVLVMRHAGDAHDALRSTMGRAAGLSVSDSTGRPRFIRWTPHPRDAAKTAHGDALDASDASTATLVPGDAKASPRQPGDTFSEAAL